jgi:uncharacterized protein
LNDTGLLAHLQGLNLERLEVNAEVIGGILENFVLMELKKQSTWSDTQPQLFYWRTASGQGVDIVLEDLGRASSRRRGECRSHSRAR